MTYLDKARAVLPENHNGWDCDGSASICDQRVEALRDLIVEHERTLASLAIERARKIAWNLDEGAHIARDSS